MTFPDRPWRPADFPKPGPSWSTRLSVLEVGQVLEPNDPAVLFDQGGGVPPFTLPPALSTADQAAHSLGIIGREAQA